MNYWPKIHKSNLIVIYPSYFYMPIQVFYLFRYEMCKPHNGWNWALSICSQICYLKFGFTYWFHEKTALGYMNDFAWSLHVNISGFQEWYHQTLKKSEITLVLFSMLPILCPSSIHLIHFVVIGFGGIHHVLLAPETLEESFPIILCRKWYGLIILGTDNLIWPQE